MDKTNRTILHGDCNGFYASVEALLNPALKNVPMAVCGDPENRHGIILAKNELAKQCGIQTTQTIWQARKLCPELTLVLPHRSQYDKYSAAVNEIYTRFTDQVEPFGIDESWLDVTGSAHLFGNGKQIADTIRDTVRSELGLTVSVGVSFTKIFAKLGSDYKKPDATTVISRENYKQIVFPLPVSDLLYVGKATKENLSRLYIRTIGDLATSDRTLLAARLGKLGEQLHDSANGLDDSPVELWGTKREVKSVGHSMTFRRNLLNMADVHLGVSILSDLVASRMRRYGLKCGTVQVVLRDPSFKNISRQITLPAPTHLAKEISAAAIGLIQKSWDLRTPIRMIAITGTHLTDESGCIEQQSLFAPTHSFDREKQEHLESAMDAIRNKFGKHAIGFGAVLRSDIGTYQSDEPEDD